MMLLTYVIAFVLGSVIGLLVRRNNSARIDPLVDAAAKAADAAKTEAEKLAKN